MFTEKVTELSYLPTAASSTRRAGKSRRKRSRQQNFECWHSTSAATENPKVQGDSDPMDAPLYHDVLAAVRYLRKTGAKRVSVVGASMGGWAAGDASIASQPGEIDRLVFLGAAPSGPADKLKSPALFIVARDDASEDGPRLPGRREQYANAPEPKELIILEGSAHAQFLFQTDQADRVMREILRFLDAK
ncbi:MAG TPA: dienelactone hydrolase family protein [Candidatus Sulfotelmatobacter sp.]|nr:dienelactone hydrolase family protein [Candidatus Sulfotelmatobacter sp.]